MTCLTRSAVLLLAINVATPPPSSAPAVAAVAPAAPLATRVDAARRAAVQEPRSDAFINAVQVYAWSEGALYRLHAAPERVSDIALQPGETLVAVAAGDTVRWIVGDTTSGAGGTRRTHVLVKPTVAGVRTNLVITTDRRVYYVELESSPRLAMTGIAWRYPQDEMLALQRATAAAEAAAPVASGLQVETLNFNYALTGDDPPWRPVRVFDDGRQTFIEFKEGTSAPEAPPLFVTGAKGEAELVNYRVRGRYYVVDRLIASAELRLGSGKQQVVRIVRTSVAKRPERRRS